MSELIFGLRPVLEALKAGKELDKVLVKQNLTGDLASELLSELRKLNVNLQYVPTEKLDRISKGGNNQGVVAYISPIEYQNAEDLIINIIEQGKTPLILALDNLTDVRNFGAIARTAECLGVDAIVIPSKNSVRVTEDAIKTSAGALYNIPVCKEENLVDFVMLLQQSGIKVFAASEKATKSIYDEDLTGPVAFVMGSEDLGVSNQITRRVDEVVKVPMVGKTESLNVSVSAGIFMYEAIRQRNIKNL